MCGRFTMANEDWSFMLDYFGLTDNGFRYPPRYNVAPTQNVMAVISDGKERRAGLLKWGLVPEWSETENHKFATFNARSETLLISKSFRNLIRRKRCVVVADGFYEWQSNTKKPYRIRVKNREVFGMAGLYDTWKSPDGRHKVHSCTIITCAPNFFIKSKALHDRMPVILGRGAVDIWLDRRVTDTETALSVLQPYDGELFAYQVPDLVGNVRNDGPECVERVG